MTVTADYFSCSTPTRHHREHKAPDRCPRRPRGSHVHRLHLAPSDIITALLAVGLTLTTFQESPNSEMYAGLGPAASHLPAV